MFFYFLLSSQFCLLQSNSEMKEQQLLFFYFKGITEMGQSNEKIPLENSSCFKEGVGTIYDVWKVQNGTYF